jgi:predicted nuclease of predicted toxin-antitoxin system
LKFVADESVEQPISRALERMGHEVWEVVLHASGIKDREVLERARQQEAILITADKGFGDLIYLEREKVRGVILLRLQGIPLRQMVQRVADAVEAHVQELEGSFLIVTSLQIRVRRLPTS